MSPRKHPPLPREFSAALWSAISARNTANLKAHMADAALASADGDLRWAMGWKRVAKRAWREAGRLYGEAIDEVNFHPDEEEP